MHTAVVTLPNPTLPDEAIFINTKQAAETIVVHISPIFKYIFIGRCSSVIPKSVILHNKFAILCIVLLLRLHKVCDGYQFNRAEKAVKICQILAQIHNKTDLVASYIPLWL